MQQSAWRHSIPEPVEKPLSQDSFLRSERGRVPFGAIHVIDRYEGRLTAHREAHIRSRNLFINRPPQRVDRFPLVFRIWQSDTWILVDARNPHLVGELHLAF